MGHSGVAARTRLGHERGGSLLQLAELQQQTADMLAGPSSRGHEPEAAGWTSLWRRRSAACAAAGCRQERGGRQRGGKPPDHGDAEAADHGREKRAVRRSAGWAVIATAATWEMQPRASAGGRVPQYPSRRSEKAEGQRAMRRSAGWARSSAQRCAASRSTRLGEKLGAQTHREPQQTANRLGVKLGAETRREPQCPPALMVREER
jgi:hypothetical protein